MALVASGGFLIGVLFHRISISIATSTTLLYVAERTSGALLPLGHTISLALAITVILYLVSRWRAYIPYLVLGSTGFAYFTNAVAHPIVTISLTALVATLGYVIQDSMLRARIKRKKMLQILRRRRLLMRT